MSKSDFLIHFLSLNNFDLLLDGRGLLGVSFEHDVISEKNINLGIKGDSVSKNSFFARKINH